MPFPYSLPVEFGRTAEAEEYARQQVQLLPPGKVWYRELTGWIHRIFLGSGEELARICARGVQLLNESDPRTATETLEDWERTYALETVSGDSIIVRRARILTAVRSQLGCRPADFQEALAPILDLDSADVDVIERSRAFCITVGDDDEIFKFFIYRDPSLPGTPNIDEAQEVVDRMKPAHTEGFIIESINFLCDDANNLCDRDLLGV